MAQRKGAGGSSGAGAGAQGPAGGNSIGGGKADPNDTIAGSMGGFSKKSIQKKAAQDLAPGSELNQRIEKGFNDELKDPSKGLSELPKVPSRTRVPNFNRLPTSEELGIIGTIVGGIMTGGPLSVAKGITKSLESPTAFQGAQSVGDGTQEAQGKAGEQTISDEEKKKRKDQQKNTLLGQAAAASPLGSPVNPIPI